MAVTISHEELRSFMTDAFTALGVEKADAGVCAEVLVQADLFGFDTHGVQRLKLYYDRILAGSIRPQTNIDVVSDKQATAVLDGHVSMGHVIAHKAMRMAMDKAKEYGVGAVAVRNSSHFGIAGYYADMAIKENMIGIITTNARPSMAPTNGVSPMLGTNPLTFGAPTDEDTPFLLDCATSIIQRAKVELSHRLGESIAEGLVINEHGKFETDPATILDKIPKAAASLIPIGGHKGYGYATLVEILSSALQDGIYLKDTLGVEHEGKKLLNVGHFFLAINIEHFINPTVFKSICGSILRSLRDSDKAPGHERIFTAGEMEYETQARRIAEGIPLHPSIQKDLLFIRDELGIEGYPFSQFA